MKRNETRGSAPTVPPPTPNQISGTIKEVGKQFGGQNDYGDWTIQSATLGGPDWEQKIKLFNHEELSREDVGLVLTATAQKGQKGNALAGIQWMDGKDEGTLKIDGRAEVVIDDAGAGEQAPPERETAPPPANGNGRATTPANGNGNGRPAPTADENEVKRKMMAVGKLHLFARHVVAKLVPEMNEIGELPPMSQDAIEHMQTSIVIAAERKGLASMVSWKLEGGAK